MLGGFRRYYESSSYGYFGPLTEILGDGTPETLNFGTASEWAGQPMLYIPLRPKKGGGQWGQVLNSIRRKLSKQGVTCFPDSNAFNGMKCNKEDSGQTYLMHTGESHVTVALHVHLMQYKNSIMEKLGLDPDTSIQDALMHARLPDGKYLFETPHRGIECPVQPAGDVIFGVAKSYEGEPIVALLPVTCPMYSLVRQSLGLPAPASNYAVHATVGYAYPKQVGNPGSPEFLRTTTPVPSSAVSQPPYHAPAMHNQTFLRKIDQE